MMNFSTKTKPGDRITGLLAIAGLAVAAGMLTPQRLNSQYASPVRVMNSTATPAIAQDVSKLASQNIQLVSQGLTPHQNVQMTQMFPNGTLNGFPFVVPSGQNFVLTAIDITPVSAPGGILDVELFNNTLPAPPVPPGRLQVFAPNASVTTQYHYPNGIVFPPGSLVDVLNSGTSAGDCFVVAYGYLTAN
jgi:hypothetical protein